MILYEVIVTATDCVPDPNQAGTGLHSFFSWHSSVRSDAGGVALPERLTAALPRLQRQVLCASGVAKPRGISRRFPNGNGWEDNDM
jgi:hypothetical protein